MFRKRKGPEEGVQGYNRISRLIAERQRELTEGDAADETLDEDTIVMPAADDAADTISLLGVRGAPAVPSERGEGTAPPLLDPPVMRTTTVAATGSELLAPATIETRAETTDTWDSEYSSNTAYMSIPDISVSAGNASLVAASAIWEGKLRSDGDIRIEGVVRGEIETAETLVVAPNARVHGNVRARNVVLGGDVEGEITCDERLEILPGGSARGQVNSGTLVVHEGAYIDSRFQMRRE